MKYWGLLSSFIIIFSAAFAKKYEDNALIYFYGYPFNTEEEIKEISEIPYIKKAEISIEWKDVYVSEGVYDWSFLDKNIALWEKSGKKIILRFMTANNATFCTSEKLIDQQRIRIVSEGFFCDFEKSILNDGFEIVNGTIDNTNSLINGNKALNLNNNSKENTALLLNSNATVFQKNSEYLIQFDFAVNQFINPNERGLFKVVFQSKGNPEHKVEEKFLVNEGEKSLFTKVISLADFHDYNLIIESHNISDCSIDNVNIIESSNSRRQRVGFPNYFSENFKLTYQNFLQAVAKKYNDNSTVEAIVIGGIGRWEEMLLNANEEGNLKVQESIYRQWNAYGYTDVNYLKNVVEWSIDLSKKLMPKKEHILQISPMNNGYKNEDFIYRRAAAMAVSKGVSIKQNGMSEKFDTWSSVSDPAYIMNRYRNNKSVKTYYETAAQIFNNGHQAMGHPESLFNRVAIDGVKNLYLYKSDILEPNVQKYFPYFDSISQVESQNKYYSNLGEYKLANRKKRYFHLLDTISYHNIWRGIRQYNEMGATVKYTTDSVMDFKAVKTNPSNPKILFDVDDRGMYNGMSNPILTIQYMDSGKDSFKVAVLNRTSGVVENVANIQKKNTGVFQLASIPLAHKFDAWDNWKEEKPEIIIHDNLDGEETINKIELDFVALNAFKTKLVNQKKSTNRTAILRDSSDKITRKIHLNIKEPLAKVEIVYCDLDFATKTDIMASVSFVNDEKELVAAQKQYYIGGDAESIILPIAENRIPKMIEIRLHDGVGKVGCYLDKKNEMAYKLFSFENKEFKNFELLKDKIMVNSYFNGLRFDKSVDVHNLQIYKVLPDNSVLKLEYSVVGKTIYLQPQTKGWYKITDKNSKTILPFAAKGLINL